MAEGIKTPFKFDGLNFPIWKVKMIVFLQSLEIRVAKSVTKPFSVPIGDEDTWSDIVTKEFDANAKVHYVLLQALNDNDIARVIHCKSAYEIWTHLVVTQTRERHKSREQKLNSCILNMKILPCMIMTPLMTW